MDVQVRQDSDQDRFVLLVDGDPAGFAAYRVRDGVTVITHSEVDPRFRGRGLGSELARLTLDQLRESGARIVPSCPFFARYVGEHPEYGDLVET